MRIQFNLGNTSLKNELASGLDFRLYLLEAVDGCGECYLSVSALIDVIESLLWSHSDAGLRSPSLESAISFVQLSTGILNDRY